MKDEKMVRRGDFRVPRSDLEEAERIFEERSPRRQAIDKAFRGPITTSIDRYRDSGGLIFDYPGVDTPTDSPRQAVEDLPFPEERRRIARDEADTLAPEPTSLRESVGDDVKETGAQGRSILDVVFGP